MTQPYIDCPKCGRRSHHPEDVKNRYCGACGWHDQPFYKPGRMGHLPAKVLCKECPLAKTSKPGALGGWTAAMYVDALHGPADIACHMSKGFQEQDHEAQRSCTGVAAYRANVGHIAMGHAHEATKHVGNEHHDACADAFASPIEFYEHHTGETIP